MSVAIPIADRIQALRQSVEQAASKVESWPQSKRDSADITLQTRSLASYYESVICATQK